MQIVQQPDPKAAQRKTVAAFVDESFDAFDSAKTVLESHIAGITVQQLKDQLVDKVLKLSELDEVTGLTKVEDQEAYRASCIKLYDFYKKKTIHLLVDATRKEGFKDRIFDDVCRYFADDTMSLKAQAHLKDNKAATKAFEKSAMSMANGDQCWNWIWQSDEEKCVIGMSTQLREDYKTLFHDMRRI